MMLKSYTFIHRYCIAQQHYAIVVSYDACSRAMLVLPQATAFSLECERNGNEQVLQRHLGLLFSLLLYNDLLLTGARSNDDNCA